MLKSIQIENYKCFFESEEILFQPNMNIVIGKNNSGKTSLLSLLSFEYPSAKPFRGPDKVAGVPLNSHSKINVEIQISGKEVERATLNARQPIYLPIDPSINPHSQEGVENAIHRLNEFVSSGVLTVRCSLSSNGNFLIDSVIEPKFGNLLSHGPGFSQYSPRVDSQRLQHSGFAGATDQRSTLIAILRTCLLSSAYVFSGERLNISRSNVVSTLKLKPDASNLAQVLLSLREDRKRFDEYVSLVQEVLPEIEDIVPAIPNDVNGEVEIRTSMVGNSYRSDLQFSLTESGTGVSQVLAILFVIVTSEFPMLIVIDEPNSFLHPGAAKQLIRIIRRFPQHQYVLSTHSSELIQTAEPEGLISVEWKNTGSGFKLLNRKNYDDLKYMLSEVGAQLSDLMGPDRIIWVEGPTEENCFPLLLDKAEAELPPHVSFAPLRATGDLIGKHKKVFYEMYERQSAAIGIVPTALAYNLDSEGLSEKDKEELKRASKGRVKFLPRRTYENYLLNPEAISTLLNRLGVQSDKEKIREWIENNGGRKEFYKDGNWDKNINDASWLRGVNAGNLLVQLFSDLSETAYEYKKIEYGVELTTWLLKHSAISIQELSDYVVDLVRTEE